MLKDKLDQCKADIAKLEEEKARLEAEMKPKLDYNKPIMTTNTRGEQCILLPLISDGNYGILGYNWFRLSDWSYNSCCTWRTKEDAVEAYGNAVNFAFDDLASRGQELEGFSVDHVTKKYTDSIEVDVCDAMVDISSETGNCGSTVVSFTTAEAEEIHLKLGQVINFAKGKQSTDG